MNDEVSMGRLTKDTEGVEVQVIRNKGDDEHYRSQG